MIDEPEECIHEGVECELNTGEDACICNCTQCENPEIGEDN